MNRRINIRLYLVIFINSIFLVVSSCWISLSSVQDRPQLILQNQEKVVLTIKGHQLKVEVADTPDKQQTGLMYRKKLSEDEGMLFVFSEAQRLSFWMKNTYIPLSIAFIDAAGKITEIVDMQPLTTIPHQSKKKCCYALEVNQNWFKKNGIKAGDVVVELKKSK